MTADELHNVRLVAERGDWLPPATALALLVELERAREAESILALLPDQNVTIADFAGLALAYLARRSTA